MPSVEISRTLVKSPPELWEDLAGGRLAEALGDANVTTSEPERLLAWEVDGASGRAIIEPSGWGTKVTLVGEVPEAPEAPVAAEGPTGAPAEAPAAEPAADHPDPAAAEPEAEPEPHPTSLDPVAPEPVAPEPVAAAVTVETDAVAAPRRPGFWARLFGRGRDAAPPVSRPQSKPAAHAPPPPADDQARPEPPAPAAAADSVPPAEADPAPVAVETLPELPPARAPFPVREETATEASVEDAEDTAPGEEIAPAEAIAPPEVEPAVSRLDAAELEARFERLLDDLGQAHRRPFSRAN